MTALACRNNPIGSTWDPAVGAPSAAVLAQLVPSGKLRVGIDTSNANLANALTTNPAAVSGIAVDVACRLGEQLGVDVEFTPYSAAAAFATGFIGNTWEVGMAANPSNATFNGPPPGPIALFATPMVSAEQAVLVPIGSTATSAFALDVVGKRISVFKGNATDRLFLTPKFHNATIVRLASEAAAGAALVTGQVDGYASARSTVTTFLNKSWPGRGRVLADLGTNDLYPIVHKGSPDANCYLKDYLEAAKASGLIAQAIVRSAGSHVGRVVGPARATCAPNARCKDVTVVSDANSCGAAASIDNGSDDADSDATCVQSPAGPYPEGSTAVTLTCTDTEGLSASCTGKVVVLDTTPPVVVTQPTTDGYVASLWPPNHSDYTFSVGDCISATDQCDGSDVTATFIGVSSDERRKGKVDDIALVDAQTISLKATRDGGGDGRVYTLYVAVSDDDGNTTTASCQVQVAHDKSGTPAVDSGIAVCLGTCN